MNPLFLLSAVLATQEPAPAEKTPSPPPPAVAAVQETRSSLIIEPKSRAHDFAQAFDLLRRERPTLKINIQTTNGTLANVSELSAAENGTLMLVKVPYSQGTKYLIVPIEEIKEIAYSP